MSSHRAAGGAGPVRLGPFQRAALDMASAPRTLKVSTADASGPDLYDAVLKTLTATAAFRAEQRCRDIPRGIPC